MRLKTTTVSANAYYRFTYDMAYGHLREVYYINCFGRKKLVARYLIGHFHAVVPGIDWPGQLCATAVPTKRITYYSYLRLKE